MRCLLFALIASTAFLTSTCYSEAASLDLQPATVISVVDGDTIWVELNREREKVRYIGIDAPETNHPIKGVQEYGAEAKAANRNSWRARSYGWSSMWGGGPGVGGTDASRWKPRNLSTSPISDIEKL